MKIVVLDGYTLNPGDLSWEPLEKLGQLQVYDRTPADLLLDRAGDSEIIFTNKTILSGAVIKDLPNLKYIGVLATGYNVVDIDAASEKKIIVTNVPSYGTNSVAQMTFALLLELTQNVGRHSHSVLNGRWNKSHDFCFWEKQLIELDGLTMGIIGLGRIGKAAAKLADAFGMNVSAYDTSPQKDVPGYVKIVELNTIFIESDVVTLHCPLTSLNEKFVNAERIGLMKKTGFLINTSRGQLVDEQALADALNNERIAGAALDVLSVEPPEQGNPLLKAKNCIITPHIAWATKAARKRLLDIAVDNLKSYLNGNPVNIVEN